MLARHSGIAASVRLTAFASPCSARAKAFSTVGSHIPSAAQLFDELFGFSQIKNLIHRWSDHLMPRPRRECAFSGG